MLRGVAAGIAGILPWLASAGIAAAQQEPPPHTAPTNPSAGGNAVALIGRTSYEFWLTCIICLVGVFIIVLLIFSISRLINPRPEDLSRPIIVVTVIISTLVLVTAGYSNEQIAPAFGLFGTIIGYILGRLTPHETAARSTPPPEQKAREEP